MGQLRERNIMRYRCMGIEGKTALLIAIVLCVMSGCSFLNVFNSDLTAVNEYYAFLREELNELEDRFLYKECDLVRSALGAPTEIHDREYFAFNDMCEKDKCNCQRGTCLQKMSDELWIYVYKNNNSCRSVLFYIQEESVVRIEN